MLAAARQSAAPPSRRASSSSASRDAPEPGLRPTKFARTEGPESQIKRSVPSSSKSSTAGLSSKANHLGEGKQEKKKSSKYKSDFLSLMKEAEKISQQAPSSNAPPAKRKDSTTSERPGTVELTAVRQGRTEVTKEREVRMPPKAPRVQESTGPVRKPASAVAPIAKNKTAPVSRKAPEAAKRAPAPLNPRAAFELARRGELDDDLDLGPTKSGKRTLDPRSAFEQAGGKVLPRDAPSSRPTSASSRSDVSREAMARARERTVVSADKARPAARPLVAGSAREKESADQQERATKRKRELEREREDAALRKRKRDRETDDRDTGRSRSTRGTRADVDPFWREDDTNGDVGAMIWQIFGKDKSK